jgi:hypothetical protein
MKESSSWSLWFGIFALCLIFVFVWYRFPIKKDDFQGSLGASVFSPESSSEKPERKWEDLLNRLQASDVSTDTEEDAIPLVEEKGSPLYYGVSKKASGITDNEIRSFKKGVTSRVFSGVNFGEQGYVYFAWPASFENSGICKAVDARTDTVVEKGTVDCIFSSFGPATSFRVEARVLVHQSGEKELYKIYRSANPVGGFFSVK